MSWNLMENNIPQEDLNNLCEFISKNPILTNSSKVMEFETVWSEWAHTKYSVYVNSGGTANLISLLVLKHKLIDEGYDENNLGEVIVSPLNWITDISSVMLCGFKPVFVDIELDTLSMSTTEIIKKTTSSTRAILLTHLMGFNALTDTLLKWCSDKNIMLIEDCCESHGATHKGKRIGSFGDMCNYSFYYGHHISTIEGGMVCTNDERLYQMIRMFRSHGLVRECTNDEMKKQYYNINPIPSPEFVFAYPSFNFRGTEIGGVLGISQIKRLDHNIEMRRRNFQLFLVNLDSSRYKTDFFTEGNSNFGLTIILKEKDDDLVNRICNKLGELKIAFRRGVAGGGNQLRQPYLQRYDFGEPEEFINTDHVHFYGLYIGNHQHVTVENIQYICDILNKV